MNIRCVLVVLGELEKGRTDGLTGELCSIYHYFNEITTTFSYRFKKSVCQNFDMVCLKTVI